MSILADLQNKSKPKAEKTLKAEISNAIKAMTTYYVHTGNYFTKFIYSEDFDIFNGNMNFQFDLEKISNQEVSLNMKVDFSCLISRAYLDYIAQKIGVELLNYALSKNITLEIVVNTFRSRLLKADCISYQSNYDFIEMLQFYQPAQIIYFQPVKMNDLSESCILGIYLLDEKDNFITKLIIQFIDEKNAPKGCKKLRVPKTVSEFYASY